MTTVTTPRRSNGRSNNDRSRGAQYEAWREAVLERDDFSCRGCGRTDHLEVHHDLPWEKFPHLRYDEDNGKTLCIDCHALVDSDRRPAGSKRRNGRSRGHKVGVWFLQGFLIFWLVVAPIWTWWVIPTFAKPHDVYSLWGWFMWMPVATVAGIYLARFAWRGAARLFRRTTVAGIYLARLAWRGLRSAAGLFRRTY